MTQTSTHKSIATLVLSLSATFTAPAWAAEEPLVESRADTAADDALGTHQRHVRLDVGVRTQYVKSRGFDPFSENDALPQLSLAASYAFWARGKLSLAGVAGFDWAAPGSEARNNDTSLDVARFTLGPEARYHVLRILVVTAKLAPTLTRESAQLDTGLGTDLKKVAWKLGFDATAGLAVEVFGYRSGQRRSPRLWLTGEGGYGWTASNRLALEPEEAGSAPQRFAPFELPDALSLSGPLFKVGAALSF